MFGLLLVLGALTMAVGCGTVGAEFDPAFVKNIVNDKTTQDEIRSMFGTPFRTGIENGNPIWVYEYNEYHAIGRDLSKDLIVVFDDKGVVKSYQLMSSNP
jgi:hypothetical protein